MAEEGAGRASHVLRSAVENRLGGASAALLLLVVFFLGGAWGGGGGGCVSSLRAKKMAGLGMLASRQVCKALGSLGSL